MLTAEERTLMIEVAESYPIGTDAQAWGYGPMGDAHPSDVSPEILAEFG